MATIADNGSSVRVVSGPATIDFPKIATKVKGVGNNISLQSYNEEITIPYTQFTSPQFTSLSDALSQINQLFDTSRLQPYIFTETQLTAPGTTPARSASLHNMGSFGIVVASIDTSVNVRAEATMDGTNFFNLDVDGHDTVITANGTYTFIWRGVYRNVRFNFVSEAGGTNATIDVGTFLTHT